MTGDFIVTSFAVLKEKPLFFLVRILLLPLFSDKYQA